MISSLDNPKVKLVQKLEDRKNRDKEAKFVIEGIRLVAEGLKSFKETKKFVFDFILYSKCLFQGKDGGPLLDELKSNQIEVFEVSDRVLSKISDVETPQGVIGVIREEKLGLVDIIRTGKSPVLVINEIQDPGNLGTIVRTADAVGAAGIIVSKGTVDLYNPKVLRGTMGSVFHLPIVRSGNLEGAIQKLKENGFVITATVVDAKSGIFDLAYSGKQAFVFGNEGEGLPDKIVGLSDRTLSIPMPGKAESLNVGVSAAIVLYEALRQSVKGN